MQFPSGAIIGMRINKGMLGYNPVGTLKITEAQCVNLNSLFKIENLGDYERTKHDIAANPVVPKIEVTVGDYFSVTGISNSVSVNYPVSSFLDELFSDPTLVYELWLDRWSADGTTIAEVWFCGDIDYNTIPATHRTGMTDPFTTNSLTPSQYYTLTANFAIERLTADIKKNYSSGGGTWTPGSILDMAYNFKIGGLYPVWQGASPITPTDQYLYPGSAPEYGFDFGPTGPVASGMVLNYIWPSGLRSLSLDSLANLIAQYAGFQTGTIDTNMMFDMYRQIYYDSAGGTTNTTSRFSNINSGGVDWSKFFVNCNFLFGNGVAVKDSWKTNGTALTGTLSGTTMHLTGSFYDTNPAYFLGLVTGTDVLLIMTDSSYVTPINSYAGVRLEFTGTLISGVLSLSGGVAGSNLNFAGTVVGSAVTLNSTGPLLFNWPCTIGAGESVLTLANWIAVQTGTWVDVAIDNGGKVVLAFRSRRTPVSAGYFTGANLSIHGGIALLSSSQEASEVPPTSVIVQCVGDDMKIMAGNNENNAVNLTVPWRCHKFGAYASGSTPFFYQGDQGQTQEQWWNRSLDFAHQGLSVTLDAKISDAGGGTGLNDYYASAPPGTAIPTQSGWVGGSMLYWDNAGSGVTQVHVFPTDERQAPTVLNGLYGVAAILPAGLSLPNDEFLGGYFNTQTAYAQFYYQELVGNKIVLVQEYDGFLGDSGTIQSLGPGLLMRTFIKGSFRTFESHSVKQNIPLNRTEIRWIEKQTNATLPPVTQIAGNGSQSSSSGSSSSSSSGGGSIIGGFVALAPAVASQSTITTGGTAVANLTLQTIASQTALALNVLSSGAASIFSVDTLGNIIGSSTVFTSAADGVVTAKFKAHSGTDTAHRAAFYDSTGAIQSWVDTNARYSSNLTFTCAATNAAVVAAASNLLTVGAGDSRYLTSAPTDTLLSDPATTARNTVTPTATGVVNLTLTQKASSTASLFKVGLSGGLNVVNVDRWGNTTLTSSGGNNVAGNLICGSIAATMSSGNTAAITLDETILTATFDCSSAAITQTLPRASNCPGRIIVISTVKFTHVLTLNPNATVPDTIGGAASLIYAISGRQSYMLQSDGVSDWVIIAKF
jgi:hypothetical protein